MVLRSALQQAMREELIARNVARIVETPTVDSQEVRPLDAAEARTLLKVAQPHRLHALWLLLVSTGLRRGEALALPWSDVDLNAGLRHSQDEAFRPNDLAASTLCAGSLCSPRAAGTRAQGRGGEVEADPGAAGRTRIQHEVRRGHGPKGPEPDAHDLVP